MVLDGQLPVDLLDVALVGVVLQAQDAVQVLVQLGGLVVEDAAEDGRAGALVRLPEPPHLQPRHLLGVLLLRSLPDEVHLVQAGLAPEDVHLAVLRRPLALAALAVLRGRLEVAVLLELHVSPVVPVPLRALQPGHLLADLGRGALRPLRLLPLAALAPAAHLEVELLAAAAHLAEELLNEGAGGRRPARRQREGEGRTSERRRRHLSLGGRRL
mmetsp:Transcript_87976/g.229493  ORF Transcript_87976/g.229493 Transcript_87976/m.229493 type:complete len:214 (-) Transcript_87976:89-730(-)